MKKNSELAYLAEVTNNGELKETLKQSYINWCVLNELTSNQKSMQIWWRQEGEGNDPNSTLKERVDYSKKWYAKYNFKLQSGSQFKDTAIKLNKKYNFAVVSD